MVGALGVNVPLLYTGVFAIGSWLGGLGGARTPHDRLGICGMIARWWAPATDVGHALLIPAGRRDSETFPPTMRLIDGHS